MDFFSGILMVIGSWFGFDTTQVTETISEPSVVIEQITTAAEQEIPQIVEQVASVVDEATSTQSESPAADTQNIISEVNDTQSMTQTNDQSEVTPNIQTMLVAGGCFWCVEADLEKTPGVISAVSGYAGGTLENPTYETYKAAGHREVVEVTYDANQISYEDILIVTMKTTDPTDDDGTFADRGDGYSSAFYYETDEQKAIIDNLIAEVNEKGPYDVPLAVDVEPRPTFWKAEDYHQDYYKGNLLQQAQYKGYRAASGRNRFIETHWGDDTSPNLGWRNEPQTTAAPASDSRYPWSDYEKPDQETLKATMDPIAYKVTQQDGTERAGTSPLDKIYEPGIYVDVLSGEPLFSSRDKFDSGTGWPSFVAPITPDALTEHEDRKLFSVRTETRSAIADNHLGHVFTDGPADRGGLRYCMNGAALRFIPEAEMEAQGYGDFLSAL